MLLREHGVCPAEPLTGLVGGPLLRRGPVKAAGRGGTCIHGDQDPPSWATSAGTSLRKLPFFSVAKYAHCLPAPMATLTLSLQGLGTAPRVSPHRQVQLTQGHHP